MFAVDGRNPFAWLEDAVELIEYLRPEYGEIYSPGLNKGIGCKVSLCSLRYAEKYEFLLLFRD